MQKKGVGPVIGILNPDDDTSIYGQELKRVKVACALSEGWHTLSLLPITLIIQMWADSTFLCLTRAAVQKDVCDWWHVCQRKHMIPSLFTFPGWQLLCNRGELSGGCELEGKIQYKIK